MRAQALFGRYWPAESPIHRLDPRTKLVGCLGLFCALFCATGPVPLACGALAVAALYALARIPLGQAARAVAPLLALVALTMLLNLLFVTGGQVYFQWWVIQVTEHGVASALFLGARLTLLVLSASLLTLTTTTLDITDGTERLLGPLARLRVPVHELAMMMALALRFLPQLARELSSVYRAQLSRCAHLSANPLAGGLRTISSLAVPLFANALRHGDALALAMDARCYHGANGATRLRQMRLHGRDAVAACALAGLLAVIILLDLAVPA